MFRIGCLLIMFCALPCLAQEEETVYSVYFDLNINPGTTKLTRIAEKFHNHYTLIPRSENDLRSTAGDELVVDFSGIYIEKNKLLSISRAEIRENPKYLVKDGYLFGVIEGDSLMTALEGDDYYFLVPKRTYLYQTNSAETPLFKGINANSFLVFSEEDNGYYSVLYLQFSGQKITLMELNFDQTELDFRAVTGSKLDGYSPPVYLLNPTADEWKKIMQQFVAYDQYELRVETD